LAEGCHPHRGWPVRRNRPLGWCFNKRSIEAITLVQSGDGLPVTTMSRQSRDSCQVHRGPKCGMMVPLVLRYEHKALSFALGKILREVMWREGVSRTREIE
jgi:hypothetical protein